MPVTANRCYRFSLFSTKSCISRVLSAGKGSFDTAIHVHCSFSRTNGQLLKLPTFPHTRRDTPRFPRLQQCIWVPNSHKLKRYCGAEPWEHPIRAFGEEFTTVLTVRRGYPW